jgi:hypothetical protein
MKQPEIQAERRGSNRAQMPTVAAMVDEIRALGFPVKVTYARENGLTVGGRIRDENAFTIPPGYLMPTNVERVKR